jgi:hypothetical protein
VLATALSAMTAVALSGGAAVIAVRAEMDEHGHEEVARAHDHHDAPLRISWERLQEIDRMLGEAKGAVAKYQDVNVARADGYLQESPVMPLEGAHFVNPRLLAAKTFDLTRPPYLVYMKGPNGGLELAGVGWALPRHADDEPAPPSPFAPLVDWHTHSFSGICVLPRGEAHESVINYYPEECDAVRGVYLGRNPWLFHAWLFVPSPEGVFALINSAIQGPEPWD